LEALPLDLEMDPKNIPKLSPVIALGFPLGRRTQADTVNVSVTSGNVRRTFENLIQIDTSLYGGNSGGPIIDTRGKVIGIVSGVAMDVSQGIFAAATPVWDIGMVVPIAKAADLLLELKAGQIKWNGVLDFSVDEDLKTIREKAGQGRWAEAMRLADTKLAASLQPAMVTAAAMMHFCAADYEGARRLFLQAITMDADDYPARLMLTLIDWLVDSPTVSPQRQTLLDLDWRSPAEFQGYLARVIAGSVEEDSALKGWYDAAEKSWLHYIVGLMHTKRGDWEGARQLTQLALLSADEESGWEFYLAYAQLDQIQRNLRDTLKTQTQWSRYNADLNEWQQALSQARTAGAERRGQMAALNARIADRTTDLEDRLQALEQSRQLAPDNRHVWAALAFYSAAAENWPAALEYVDQFLKTDGRRTTRYMSLELLKACILNYQADEAQTRRVLEKYAAETRDSWYISISEYLRGQQTEQSLRDNARAIPEKILTAYTFMGFWAEGSGEREKALKHYKEALGSFLDDWLEYNFALERIKKIKKPAG
jgi:tetratricopeptide (TPR) repeat protein